MTAPPRPGRAAKRDRASSRQAFVAGRAGVFDRAAVADAADRALTAHLREAADDAGAELVPHVFPDSDTARWVPIGPSVARRGQANGRPRVTGRIRDVAVSADGSRAYAASAMGGVWYSDDGGGTWSPVGGWADRTARSGGANNAQACGCLLVTFGATSADDFVLVGTGETRGDAYTTKQDALGSGVFQGLGVLAAHGPAAGAVGDNPWEAEAGAALLEGSGCFRLARDPAVAAANVFVDGTDRVLAATSTGLYLGARTGGVFTWSKPPGIDTLVAAVPPVPNAVTPQVSDVLWVPLAGNANGRVVVAISQFGVAYSDDLGQHFQWLNGCNTPGGQQIQGFSSLARVAGTTTVYILSALPQTPNAATPASAPFAPDDTPALWQVADITPAGQPQAVQVGGVPLGLWPTQRDYDQAIVVDRVAGVDRVYLGGSTTWLDQEWASSLWCFDVGAGPALTPTAGVSVMGAPNAAGTGGDGADAAGCIGNNVHADVHTLVLTGTAPTRQLWVGCDGGVYVSSSAGRVNTFASRSVGLGTLQAGYVAVHPTSSHFAAVGFQDNGTQVRSGDTMWEEIFEGDGGGVVFHPNLSQYVVGQYTNSSWQSAPSAGFVTPTTRRFQGVIGADREGNGNVSSFYSGAAAVQVSPTAARVALGTNRVWVTDDVGSAAANTWLALPYPTGTATDARPGGADPMPLFGVPAGAPLGALFVSPVFGTIGPLREIVTVRWASATVLLVLFENGVVRWTETSARHWTAALVVVGAAVPANTLLTDIFPVPNTADFYLTTTGDPASAATDTCYLWDDTGQQLLPTGLRHRLDPPAPPAGVVGPLEPAYAVVVDPQSVTDVYVGTVTGVWHGVRAAGGNHVDWKQPAFVNGLPQAAVQDLTIWQDPSGAAGQPRLMRAALQARGVWEVDLAHPEPVRTYLRVHARDDRRRFPTPMANPRQSPTASAERVFTSPDITLRPAANPATAPRWPFGTGAISASNAPPYQLWTFQTAFRWIYPSVVAHGLWSDQLGDLIELHRATHAMTAGRIIDKTLWDAVVGGTRLDASGAVSATGADLAVYRAPWQTPTSMNAVATEVDLVETVQPRSLTENVWSAFSEPSTVDILLHHRDTRPVPAGGAFAILLWQSGPSGSAMLAQDGSTIAAFAASAAAGTPVTTPAGWQLATGGAISVVQTLPTPLEARLPRAVSVDVDLSHVPGNHRVLFLAIGGSSADPCATPPVNLPANPTVSDLVRCWPYAALRLAIMSPRS